MTWLVYGPVAAAAPQPALSMTWTTDAPKDVEVGGTVVEGWRDAAGPEVPGESVVEVLSSDGAVERAGNVVVEVVKGDTAPVIGGGRPATSMIRVPVR